MYKRELEKIRREDMTFLALDSQRSLFMLQKSQVTFEMTLIMNQANFVMKQMDSYQSEAEEANGGNPVDLDNDPYYIALQQEEEYLTVRQASLEEQVTLLDNSISSLKTMAQNNIKSSCGLNLIGS